MTTRGRHQGMASGAARAGISLMMALSMALGSVPALALEDPIATEAPAQEQTVEDDGIEELATTDEVTTDAILIKDGAEGAADATDVSGGDGTEANGESGVELADDSSDEPQAEPQAGSQAEPDEEQIAEEQLIDSSDAKAEDVLLSVQSASYQNLPLNGSTTHGYFSYKGQDDFYTFTLAKSARVKLELQNWTSGDVWWGLYNDSMTTCHASNYCNAKNPGTLSIDSYLDAGMYRLKVHSGWSSTSTGGSGTGDYQIRANKNDATSPVRNDNATFDTAAALPAGTVGTSVFTLTGAGSNYWRIQVPTDEKIRIICKETESDCNAVKGLYLYDAACKQINWWEVNPTCTIERQLAAGTYYIKVNRYDSGPYSIQWEAVTYDLANSETCLDRTSYTYNGKAKRPGAVVKYGSTILQQGIDYTVTYQNNVSAGTGTAIIQGKGHYTGTLTRTFVISKAKQPMSVTAKTMTVKRKSLRRKSVTIAPIKVAKAKGKVTYAKVSGSKRLSINKSTGKVTVKKGTKSGTYKIKVKVKAAATANYKARTITRTVKVVVK